MSNKAITWALEKKTGSCTTKMVLFKIADQANDNGECWPSQTTIAKHCEINRSTVNRHIKRLSELGLVKIIHRTKDGVSLPNMYQLIGVGAEEHMGGRTQSQGVGAEEHTNPHIEPSLNPHSSEDKNLRADADPIKALFDSGVGILTKAGTPPKGARALIGKLRKAKGDDEAFRVIREARDKSDPAAWIAAAAKNRSAEAEAALRGVKF